MVIDLNSIWCIFFSKLLFFSDVLFQFVLLNFTFRSTNGTVSTSFRLCCSVQSIEVEDLSDSGSIYIQSDGEHLGFLPRKICILPAVIEMIC